MRVLLIAATERPAIERLVPALATLVARGATLEATPPAAQLLAAEGLACVAIKPGPALDAALRGLDGGDLLIAPHAPGAPRTDPDVAAALARALAAPDGPLLLVDVEAAGDLLAALAVGPTPAVREGLRQAALAALAAALAGGPGLLPPAAPAPGSTAEWPERALVVLERVRTFGHGENPHQRAAAYRRLGAAPGGPLAAPLAQGDEPTLNDLLDLDAGARLVADLPAPSAAVIRHTDPIGVATAETTYGAFSRAVETDAAAATGAVVALNVAIDRATAAEIVAGSYEAVVAPAVADDATRAILAGRRDLRVLLYAAHPPDAPEMIEIDGAVLLQTRDHGAIERSELRVVTERRPSLDELTDLLFAWRVVRHVRSNAIVVARSGATLGIGAGQVNRRIAVDIALQRAADRARGGVMASDAYFPFAEGITAAAAAGITAVVQPGGSRRDAAAIEIADRMGLAMVFTGRRHYRR